MSKQATAGTPGAARRTAAIAGERRGWCSGASARQRLERRDDLVVDHAPASRKRVAAVDDAVADRVGLAELARAPRRRRSSGARSRSASELVAVVEQPQLEAARAGVDDEDAHARSALRPASSRATSGGSSPCSRV